MKKLNFKGSALLQVLVLSALISTIVVVLLKFAITRTSNTIQTKHIVGAKIAMQSCMSLLNEEELSRMNNGLSSYFEENETFTCSIDNYSVNIKRGVLGQEFSHNQGIVRPLEFSITFFQPGAGGEDEEEDSTQVQIADQNQVI